MATAVTRRATAIPVPLLELGRYIDNEDEILGKSAVTIKAVGHGRIGKASDSQAFYIPSVD